MSLILSVLILPFEDWMILEAVMPDPVAVIVPAPSCSSSTHVPLARRTRICSALMLPADVELSRIHSRPALMVPLSWSSGLSCKPSRTSVEEEPMTPLLAFCDTFPLMSSVPFSVNASTAA